MHSRWPQPMQRPLSVNLRRRHGPAGDLPSRYTTCSGNRFCGSEDSQYVRFSGAEQPGTSPTLVTRGDPGQRRSTHPCLGREVRDRRLCLVPHEIDLLARLFGQMGARLMMRCLMPSTNEDPRCAPSPERGQPVPRRSDWRAALAAIITGLVVLPRWQRLNRRLHSIRHLRASRALTSRLWPVTNSTVLRPGSCSVSSFSCGSSLWWMVPLQDVRYMLLDPRRLPYLRSPSLRTAWYPDCHRPRPVLPAVTSGGSCDWGPSPQTLRAR